MRVLLLVAATIFVETLLFSVLTPLLPHYVEAHDLSKTGAGLLQAGVAIGAIAGAVPSGFAASRIGVKPTVLAGLGALAASSALFGVADRVWVLDAARILQGVAGALIWTGGLAWLIASAPATRRGELIGSAFGVAVGGSLFGPVVGAVAARLGTGAVFGALAVLAGVLAAWAASVPGVEAGPRQSLARLGPALRTRAVLAATWLVTLAVLLAAAMSVLAPLRLSALGLGATAIAATWLVAAALQAVLSPLLGRLADRRGRLLPIAIGASCCGVSAALLPWPRASWLLAVVVVAASVSTIAFLTPAMTLLADACHEGGLDHGWSFAVVNVAWAPGQVVGALAAGAVAGAAGDTTVYLGLAVLFALTLGGLRRSGAPGLPSAAR